MDNMLEWTRSLLEKSGTRTTPIIACDLNDGLGKQRREDGRLELVEDEVVGRREAQ